MKEHEIATRTTRRPLDVALVGGRGFYSNYGGVENAIREISLEMAKRGMNVNVYGNCERDEHVNKPNNISTIRIPNYVYHKLGQHGLAMFSVFHLIFSNRPKAVIIFASGPCIFAPFLRLFGLKVVTSLRAIDSSRDKWGKISRTILKIGEYCSWKFATHFTVNSREMYDKYRANRRSVQFIPNGAKPVRNRGGQVLEKLGIKSQEYFLFASRLDPAKRLHLLLEAYSKLEKDIRIPLVVAGGNTKDESYEKFLRDSAPEGVIFLGHVNLDVLDPLMLHCRAFILPSVVEGMSNSLLTAIASSKAVLVSNIPPNADVVRGCEEVLFNVDDVDDLYRGLKRLAQNKAYCMEVGKKLGDIARENYSWKASTDAFCELIK